LPGSDVGAVVGFAGGAAEHPETEKLQLVAKTDVPIRALD
jgi:hypothetical protein